MTNAQSVEVDAVEADLHAFPGSYRTSEELRVANASMMNLNPTFASWLTGLTSVAADL